VHLDALLSNLLNLEKSQRRGAIQIAMDQPDAQLTTLMNELDASQQRMSALAHEMTTNHPTYVNAKAAAQDLYRKVDDRVEGILLGLQNRRDATVARIAELEQRLKSYRSSLSAAADYNAARQKLADLTAAGSSLETKIEGQKSDLMLPRNSQVEIVDHAEASYNPASFRHPTTLSLALIGLGVLLNLLGIQMLRGHREVPAAQLASL